ncbi:MAG: hypothetical protein Q7R81_02900 [Candidatus Peregrinibacteria bacterium]|nr:hypothetical protein [Candidatus Peregrinibacteria bacterium]
MPTFTVLIGWLAGVLTFAAYVPYFISMVRGKTKPNRATWWILLIVGVMLAGGYYSLGAKDTIWVPIGYVVGPLVIAIFSLWFGEGGWSRFDRSCLMGAAVAGVLWWLFNAPLTALIINLVMDWLGLMPTVRKAYHRPHTEDRLSWMCWFAGSFVNLFAVGHWTAELAVYPIYMVVGNGIIATLVCWPRKQSTVQSRPS